MKKIFLALFALLFATCYFLPVKAADETLTDWVIRDFQSEIIVNKDSSLDITERITADCGNLPNKHGIFRTLPIISETIDGQEFKTPVELISISDFSGKLYKYSTTDNTTTIEWKIGDADKTVRGINEYQIKYHVKNAIRTGNSEFDELYWNLSGNFWKINIDHFSAKIKFPEEINQDNSKLWVYSGNKDEKGDLYSTHSWEDNNTLLFESTDILYPGYGITASVTFPKNIVTPYNFTFIEKYGDVFGLFFFPFFALILGLIFWKIYGDDPNINKSITPEFDVPDNLSPGKIGSILHNGHFSNKAFAASLIHLAVNKKITIKELGKKSLLKKADYEFALIPESKYKPDQVEQSLITNFFGESGRFSLSELRNDDNAFINFAKVSKEAKRSVMSEGYLDKNSFKMLVVMLIAYVVISGIVLLTLYFLNSYLDAIAGAVLGAPIIIIFAFLMPKRTQKGAEFLWKIKGFKLYMEKAEKYRSQFLEQENIFEKLLPYAIMFGLTKQWIHAVEQIRGQAYFNSYHPVWFTGDFTNFDANSFASAMESVSSSVGTSSGASGGGGAGGGGGGGGGGGW